MDVILLARIFALKVEADAVNAFIEYMKIENITRIDTEGNPAYGAERFEEKSNQLTNIANELRGIGSL